MAEKIETIERQFTSVCRGAETIRRNADDARGLHKDDATEDGVELLRQIERDCETLRLQCVQLRVALGNPGHPPGPADHLSLP